MPIINQAYKTDVNRCSGPIYFPGEKYSFYINFKDPISDLDFANFRLDLRKYGNPVAYLQGIGTLQKDQINSYFYNIYAEFTFPGNVPFGQYQFAIYDTVALVTKAVSSLIIVEESALVKNTAYVAYRHSFDKYNYRYETLPAFFNLFRVPLIQTGFNIEQDRQQYRNISNKKLRNLEGFSDNVYKLEAYNHNEAGHKALAAVFDHDTIFLDDTFVTAKSPYNAEDNLRSVLSKGSVEVVVDESKTIPSYIALPKTYLNGLEFSLSTSDNEAGVNGTAAGTDPQLRFEFNGIAPLAGLPASMLISVNGNAELLIDFFSDYIGHQFRFTSNAGIQYYGTFVNAPVNY